MSLLYININHITILIDCELKMAKGSPIYFSSV